MKHSHSGKVALVTGAASGIGRCIAQQLAQAGARVYVLDKNAIAAKEVVQAINEQGGNAKACIADLAEPTSLMQAVSESARAFGPPDILINNAGIAKLVKAVECPLEHWQLTVAINITAPMLLMQWALPHMQQTNWGRIVNVASISGLRAGTGRVAYGTSKAALIAMTRQFAIEAGNPGITVNAIAPGAIDTPLAQASHSEETRQAYGRMIPMRRYGSVEEVAGGIDFLCSQQASYITGQTLVIDGGFMAAGMLAGDLFKQAAA